MMSFESPDESIPVLIFRLIVAPIAILGNGIILYIFIKFKKFRVSVANCLIGWLSLGELVIGIGILIRAFYTLYIAANNIFIYDRFSCMAIALPQIFGIVYTQIILLGMAVDRFIAIRKPMLYYKNQSQKRLYGAILTAIFLGVTFSVYSMIGLEKTPPEQCSSGAATTKFFAVSWGLFSVLMAFLIFGFYITTVCILMKRTKSSDQSSSLSMQRQKKVFVSISLILLSYAIFWCLPLLGGIIVETTSFDPVLLGYVTLVIGLCSGVNSCVGIFVYLAKHQELKEHFWKILPICGKMAKKNQVQMVTPFVSTINRSTIVVSTMNNRQTMSSHI